MSLLGGIEPVRQSPAVGPKSRVALGRASPESLNREAAVSARGISKSFREGHALIEVDLDLAAGIVLGLLGPNGAGKTTLVRILATLLRADAGTARVLGFDVAQDAAEVRKRIGLVGQYAAVDENLTGLENLVMVGRLYGSSRRDATGRGPRAAGTLRARRCGQTNRQDVLGRDAAPPRPRGRTSGRATRAVPGRAHHRARPAQPDRYVGDHRAAGGRRHHGAAHDPVPGRGRPAGRHDRGDRPRDGDRPGHIRSAQGSDRIGGERLEVRLEDRSQCEAAMRALGPMSDEVPAIEGHVVTMHVRRRSGTVVESVRRLSDVGVDVGDLALRRPTLDDVFLTLTGHTAEEENPE